MKGWVEILHKYMILLHFFHYFCVLNITLYFSLVFALLLHATETWLCSSREVGYLCFSLLLIPINIIVSINSTN